MIALFKLVFAFKNRHIKTLSNFLFQFLIPILKKKIVIKIYLQSIVSYNFFWKSLNFTICYNIIKISCFLNLLVKDALF